MTFVDNARRDSSADRARQKAVFRATCAVILGIVCSMPSHAAEAHDLSRVIRIDIPAQPLSGALLQLARQAHMPIMFSTTLTRRLSAPEVHGAFTEHEALRDLLRHSGLGFIQQGGTVKIVPLKDSAKAAHHSSQSHSARPHRPIQAIALQEVVVTGSHIRGGPPPSAPIITITRRDIEESGYQSVEQVMAALPENFASVGSGQTYGVTSQDESGNISNGAAVDLNGLGFDSTLVLVNGHRIAPSGSAGAFTDISVIPLSAIKRIDVMTEGASAIYGSDAVGGVVNYILKSSQSGEHTSMEYGSVTRGGLKDFRLSQSAGGSWNGGGGLISYEYHKQTPLSGEDRPFSQSSQFYEPTDLLPRTVQNNVYGTATQRLDRNTKINGDAFYEHRDARSSLTAGGLYETVVSAAQYSMGAGIKRKLMGHWSATARIDYGGSNATSGDVLGTDISHSRLLSVDAGMTGSLFRIPFGAVKAAFGSQWRRESFALRETGPFSAGGTPLDRSRTVTALYAEARIPLWRREESGSFSSASLDLAGRYEHYSDFGSSMNPMAGLAWQPIPALRVRGTVGWSFRAPNFSELYGGEQALLSNSPLPSGNGSAAVLILAGSNPALKPEKSMEWTAGIDFMPPDSAWSLKATYFHVHFKDRIASPNLPILAALDQGPAYSPYIRLNPSYAELTSLVDGANGYANDTVYPCCGPARMLTDATAIADNRLQNLSALSVDGVDATGGLHGRLRQAEYRMGVEVSYLLKYENVFVPGETPIELLSTFENPVNFRTRVTSSLTLSRVLVHGALNYTNHYDNAPGALPHRIASWTTLDVGVEYRLPKMGALSHAAVQVACTNCMDRMPPDVGLSQYVFGYDPTNANPLGRFVSASIRAAW